MLFRGNNQFLHLDSDGKLQDFFTLHGHKLKIDWCSWFILPWLNLLFCFVLFYFPNTLLFPQHTCSVCFSFLIELAIDFHFHENVLTLHCYGAGFIAMHATLASRDVDCCLIPELPFYLEGPGGLFEYIEKRLKENGHMVLVIAEGAGQDLLSESIQSLDKQDASGNKLLQDVGLWISQKIKVWI